MRNRASHLSRATGYQLRLLVLRAAIATINDNRFCATSPGSCPHPVMLPWQSRYYSLSISPRRSGLVALQEQRTAEVNSHSAALTHGIGDSIGRAAIITTQIFSRR